MFSHTPKNPTPRTINADEASALLADLGHIADLIDVITADENTALAAASPDAPSATISATSTARSGGLFAPSVGQDSTRLIATASDDFSYSNHAYIFECIQQLVNNRSYTVSDYEDTLLHKVRTYFTTNKQAFLNATVDELYDENDNFGYVFSQFTNLLLKANGHYGDELFKIYMTIIDAHKSSETLFHKYVYKFIQKYLSEFKLPASQGAPTPAQVLELTNPSDLRKLSFLVNHGKFNINFESVLGFSLLGSSGIFKHLFTQAYYNATNMRFSAVLEVLLNSPHLECNKNYSACGEINPSFRSSDGRTGLEKYNLSKLDQVAKKLAYLTICRATKLTEFPNLRANTANAFHYIPLDLVDMIGEKSFGSDYTTTDQARKLKK